MVHDLAAFERAPHECHLTDEQLDAALFAPRPYLFGHVGEDAAGLLHGFALWFVNFSTWTGEHGIYLEDLYVRPEARGTGLGRALVATLAGICVDRGYHRLSWAMLDWNPAAAFYAGLGAAPHADWVPYRLDGDALAGLAKQRP
jgi:GNAT superfamily N-acetyltransferase